MGGLSGKQRECAPYNVRPPIWVDSGLDAENVVQILQQHKISGYDSEFDNVDVSSESCVGKSRLDVFSISVPTADIAPLGYPKTISWVFDGWLINYPSIKEWLENPEYTKCIHNAPVDYHTARNSGVVIRGILNTLSMARWVYPERAALIRGNYDLDSLCKWRCGIGKTLDFSDIFIYDAEEEYEGEFIKKRCLGCGVIGCRKRKEPHDRKEEVLVRETRTRTVKRVRPLSMVRRNGEYSHLFEDYVEYAATDSDLSLIIYYLMMEDGKQERYYPWTP
jgi:hypothetical protein